MSIVEKVIGKIRDEPAWVGEPPRSDAHVTVLQPSDLLSRDDLGSARPVRISDESNDALGEVWHGKAPEAIFAHFRGVRREMLALLKDTIAAGSAPIVLVTSPLPGDGKTFVSASIARTFANAPDFRVMLLDLDLMRRRTSAVFGAENLTGVSDVLTGGADLRSVVCVTDVPRLKFIPAGSAGSSNREAFIGERLDEMLTRLRSTGRNTLHLLDAPPLIPVVETALLAGKADLVVFVVRAGITPKSAVADALAKLDADCKVCLVLNGFAQHPLGHDYDYAYAAYGSPQQNG